jgi:ubiquinone/menaquinone biosynthesis C-methylase UbiE
VGVDISKTMVQHAQQKVTVALLDGRVRFQTMDALGMLDFQTSSFDLVNQRLGASWLRTWEWSKILAEYRRVCRPSGVIRLTEGNVVLESNSPALTKLNGITLEAFYHSGRLFEAQSDGLTGHLVDLMTQHGILNVQAEVHRLVCSAGTNIHQSFYEDAIRFYRVSLPFLQKWVHVPGDYQEIYQQALKEMQAAEFAATWTWFTVCGTRPEGIL